jgi:hypothetical protein
MSKFFTYFPKIEYDIEKNNINNLVTNVIRRFKITSDALENGAVFYDYEVQEGDRPDIIADKFYGDANLAWLVLYYNEIMDANFGLPLSTYEFESYLIEKYGSLALARSTVNRYEQIIEAERKVDEGDITKPERTIIVDQTTYDSLSPNDRKIIYAYEYEVELNNDKRNIKLISPDYVPLILDEVKKVFD